MTRIIKLQTVYRDQKWTRQIKKVPKLTLSGNWLQNAGFLPHKKIYVTVEEGRLVITSEIAL
jgi:hypothetical protein